MVEIEVLSVCLEILVEEEGQPRLEPWLSLFRHKNFEHILKTSVEIRVVRIQRSTKWKFEN